MKLREICEITGVKYNESHPKRSLKEIEKYYIINQVGKRDYEIVRELNDDEKYEIRSLSDCKQLLRDVIIMDLSFIKDNIIRTDIKGYLELFKMVNNKYRYFTYPDLTERKKKILEDTDLSNDELFIFVSDVSTMLNSALKDVFNRLEDEKLIAKTDILMIGTSRIVIDMNNKTIQIREHHEATKDEIEMVLKLKKKYMNEIGYNLWSDVSYFRKIEINNKICKDMKIDYMYYEYELILNREFIKLEANNELKSRLNNSIIDKILRSKKGLLKYMPIENKIKNTDFIIKC